MDKSTKVKIVYINILKKNLLLIFLLIVAKTEAQLTCSATSFPSTCTANGTITASANGGSGSYNYQLNAASSCLSQSILQNGNTFNALKPCTYTLIVNDLVTGAQCQTTVTVGGSYVLPNLSLQVTNCKIVSNLIGGNDPFLYAYSTTSNSGPFIPNTPPTKSVFTGLPNGTVWVQVQDSCGNTFIQQATVGANPIATFSYTFSNNILTVTSVTGGNAPYTYKLQTNSGTTSNQTGVFNNPAIDCNTKITVSDSCTSKIVTYNITPDANVACVNFFGGTASLNSSGGVPPLVFQALVNNVVVGTSTNGQFTNLPTTPIVKKYDFKVIDACNRIKSLSIDAINPRFTGTVACGTGGSTNLQIVRNNGSSIPLFYPISVSVPTANPTNVTLNSPTTMATFNSLSGNPNIFTIQDICGEKIICKDTLILNLASNCVNITAALRKRFKCDNGTSDDEVGLVGVVTYTLKDANGVVIETNTSGNFTATGPGTYTVTAVHATCGTITSTITVNPGSTQINPLIEVMLRYRVVNGKCVPRYTLRIPESDGPFFLSGANNVNAYLNTPTAGYYITMDLMSGNYTLTSTTLCTSVSVNLPRPSYNLTAQVTQTCPGDAQVLVTGAKDFTYWKSWFQSNTSSNLNLVTWYNNNGPHKDFYNTLPNNTYTGFFGDPFTIKNLTVGQPYTLYIYPFDAKESGGGCPVDTVSVNIPSYNQFKAGATRGIICDGQTSADVKVWVQPINTTIKSSGKKPYTFQRVNCTNLTTPLGNSINTSDTSVTFPSLTQGTHCFKVLDACGVSADYQSDVAPLGAGQYIAVNCGLLRLQLDTIPGAIYVWKNAAGQVLSNKYFSLVPTPNAQATFTCDVTIAGCMMQRSVTIPAGVGLVTVNITPSAPTTFCNGQNVTLLANGNANFYTWSNGQTGTTIVVNQQGIYSVTATNLIGCTKTADISITVVPSVSATLLPQNSTCFAKNNGKIEVQITNNQGLNFLWSNGSTSLIQNNLSPNTYVLTITDAYNCKTIYNATITQPPLLSSYINAQNITCAGQNNGTAELIPSGGTAPYTYLWNNNTTGQSINNLAKGNYAVVVTDAKGCTSSSKIDVTEPAPLQLTTNPQNPTVCIGENTLITAIPTGGNGSFSYLWSNGSTQASQTLGKGSYAVSITDIKGCKSNTNVKIIETATVSVPLLDNDKLCAGTAKKLEVGGNFKSYRWNTGATSSVINISEAKQYCVTVTTQGGCLGDTCINISQTPNPKPFINGDTLICKESKTILKVNTSFEKYQWNNGILSQENKVSFGKHQVTVTDLNGCKGIADYEIKARLAPNVVILPNKKLCLGDSIRLKVNATALDFTWSDGKKSDEILVKNQGKYCVTISDKYGCHNDTCLDVVTFPLPKPTIIGDSIFCKNDTVTLRCNEDFVTYEWSNKSTNKITNTYLSGIYTLKVSDSNACVGFANYRIKALPLPEVLILGDTFFCKGQQVKLFLDKKFPRQIWSNQSQSDTIFLNQKGIISIVVRDSLGCENSAKIQLKENPLPKPTIEGITAICNKSSTNLNVKENYKTYLWSNQATTKTIKITQAGNYTVTVTDENNCQNTVSQEVKSVAKLLPAISGDTAFCEGRKSTLSVDTTFAKYLWSNAEKKPQITVNQTNTYCVTVSDINGCLGDTCFKVKVNPKPKAAITGKNLICGNQETTLKIAPLGLKYFWSNGETATEIKVKAGYYQVTFSDTKGCEDTLSKKVATAPDVELQAKAILQDNNLSISCWGKNDGKAEILVSNGTAPFQYLWSNAKKTKNIENLKAGKYLITVTDALGCFKIDSVQLREPELLDFLAKANAVACFGESNGYISLDSIMGGNENIFYSFNNQDFIKIKNTPLIINKLPKGNYTIKIKDKKGCQAQQNFTIKSPDKLLLSIAAIDTIIKGDSARIIPTLSFIPDSLRWSPAKILSCATCLEPYVKPKQFLSHLKLTAWKNGCPAFGELEIVSREYRKHKVFIPNIFSPNGDNTNDIFSVMNNPTVAEVERLEVYDRWGELTWVGTNFIPEKLGWDGTFRGKPMNSAVFVYVAYVRFKDGVKEKFVGDVTLLR